MTDHSLLNMDLYIKKRFDIGPFKFSGVGTCSGCKDVRLLIHNDLLTLQSYCYDCYVKMSTDFAMRRGDLGNKNWQFLCSHNRYKNIRDLLYECDPSIDLTDPDPEYDDDEEDSTNETTNLEDR